MDRASPPAELLGVDCHRWADLDSSSSPDRSRLRCGHYCHVATCVCSGGWSGQLPLFWAVRRCYAHTLMKAHEASSTSHQPPPWNLCAQLHRSFTIRRLRTGSLGAQRRQMVFVGTTRLLRSSYRQLDSYTAADFLRAALHSGRPLLAHALSPREQRPAASSCLPRLQTQMKVACRAARQWTSRLLSSNPESIRISYACYLSLQITG